MIANLETRAAEIRDAQTAEDRFELKHASLSNALEGALRDLCNVVPLEGRSARSGQSLVVMLLVGFRNKEDLSSSIQKAAVPELQSLRDWGWAPQSGVGRINEGKQ